MPRSAAGLDRKIRRRHPPSVCACCAIHFCRSCAPPARPRPLSSISNVKRSGSNRSRILHLGGLGVFDDVVHGFLEGEENIVPHVGRDGVRRQLRRARPAGSASRPAQSNPAHTCRRSSPSLRACRWTGFAAQTISSSASAVSRAVCEICRAWAFDFARHILVRFDHFTEQRHLGQVGAELIVQVARDAGAFFFEGFLLPQLRELPLEFLRGDEMTRWPHDQAQTRQGEKPPRPARRAARR